MNQTKWDRWRSLILWWTSWTLSAVQITTQSAIRAWCGLVSPIVLRNLGSILEAQNQQYGMRIFTIDGYNGDALDFIIKLLDESNALCFGTGIDASQLVLDEFIVNLINRATRPIIFDGQITQYLSKNQLSINSKVWHIIILNKKEISKFFLLEDPLESEIINIAQNLKSTILLKWETTRVVTQNGEVHSIFTWSYPQMLMAGAWDVLAGIITSLIAQGYASIEAILLWIRLRESATQKYIEMTGDVIATPYDIVNHLRFVIKNILYPLK